MAGHNAARTSTLWIAAAGTLASAQVSRVQQVRALAPEEARRGYPIPLRVLVTYFDPVAPNLFVQDSTGAMWVEWPRGGQEPEPAQLIDLQGIMTQPDFAPDITHTV